MTHRGFIIRGFRCLERLSAWKIAIIGISLAILVGTVDTICGDEYPLSLFYLIPISLFAWYLNIVFSMLLSICCVMVWLNANVSSMKTEGGMLWATITTLGYYLFFSIIISNVKILYDSQVNALKRDQLTGLYNMKSFIEIVNNDIEILDRSREWFSVVYLEVTDLKKINVNYGYNIGDTVLTNFSNVISKSLRKSDKFSRLGGGEFALFLPNTNHVTVKEIIDRINQILITNKIYLCSNYNYRIGVISCFKPKIQLESIISRAKKLCLESQQGEGAGINYGVLK